MNKKEFEDIIRPLVLLPSDQRKLLKEVLIKNFNKWSENKQLAISRVSWRSEQLDCEHPESDLVDICKGVKLCKCSSWIEEAN